MQFDDRQRRMLEAGAFHFDSAGDNTANFNAAWALERLGLVSISVNEYTQHSVYSCTVTDVGRAALSHQKTLRPPNDAVQKGS